MTGHVRLLVAITFIVWAGRSCQSRDSAEIVATLPFGFVVGGKILPAGTYTVSRLSDSSHLQNR
jgi:hypothetical protein